jgi:allantoin racemase
MLHAIKQAEKDGYDAAVIGCFYDPFLREAREICDRMVVTAPAESSLQLAAALGDTFSVIVSRRKCIPAMRNNVLQYGYGVKLASFRGLGVLDLHADERCTEQRIRTEAKKAVEEDGAETIILECAIQLGFYKDLQDVLGVPVIDVLLALFKHAEFLIEVRDRFGWLLSKVGVFETPPAKEIKDWGMEEQYGVSGLWTEK